MLAANVIIDKHCPSPGLTRACEEGKVEFVEALLKYGTNVYVLYKYHNCAKLYRKISRVCCRLYCYKYAAQVPMPMTANKWYSLVLW